MKYMVRAVSCDADGKVTDIADTWPLNATTVEEAKPRLTDNTGDSPATSRTPSRLRTHPGTHLPGAPSARAAIQLRGPEHGLVGVRGASRILCARGPKESSRPSSSRIRSASGVWG